MGLLEYRFLRFSASAAFTVAMISCGNEGAEKEGGSTCPEGQVECDGACVSLQTSEAHCGTCGVPCGTGESCVDGACECGSDQERCTDSCTDVGSDPENCGDCGVACDATEVCLLGECQADCAAGYTECARSCVDVNTTEAHCGDCETECRTGQDCVDGACVCPEGEDLCNGACVTTATDPLHCGSCDTRCDEDQVCQAGSCRTEGGGNGGASGGVTDPEGGGNGGESGGVTDPPPIEESCEPTVSLRDTAGANVVGTGTPGSCTEEALRNLAEQGGVVTFDCGPEPVTIELTETIELRNDADTLIDGGGLITLDAGHRTRHFHYESGNWMVTMTRVTLQRLTFRNGSAPAGEYFPPVDGYPECAYGYKEGSGGAIQMRDGVLEVIDCDFFDNEAALVGPDVGGGAIYVLGAARVVISGSRFIGNRAANGGAIGMLFANPEIYNSVFEDNTAEGTGQNRAVSEDECPAIYEFGHANQAGAGGLAGAVYFDGANDEGQTYVVCGSVFRNNRANELAGALFRTPNVGMRTMLIENSTFDSNTARGGGVSFIKQNAVTVRGSVFLNNRSGVTIDGTDVGGWASGLWINEGTVDAANTTFFGNALDVEGEGSARNVTFADSGINGNLTINNSLIVNTSCNAGSPGDHNVQWPEGDACAGGTSFANPALGNPADNGGPTFTMLPGNTEAVAAVGTDCPTTDQRGTPRDTTSCAAGAVEP